MATSDLGAKVFELGETVNDDGDMVPAYGFVHNGVFIADPYVSDCGRFDAKPSHYGLNDADAERLVALNAELRS